MAWDVLWKLSSQEDGLGSHPWKSFPLSLEGETSTWNSWLTFLSLERTRSKHSLPTAKTRLHTEPSRLTFFREVKPKVDCKVFHLWIFLCQLPSTVASVSEREGYCMLRTLCRPPPRFLLSQPPYSNTPPPQVCLYPLPLHPPPSSSPDFKLHVASSSRQLQQQNVDFQLQAANSKQGGSK